MRQAANNRLRSFEREIHLLRKMDGETALLDEYNSHLASSSSASDVPRHATTKFNEHDNYPVCTSRFEYNDRMSQPTTIQPGGASTSSAQQQQNHHQDGGRDDRDRDHHRDRRRQHSDMERHEVAVDMNDADTDIEEELSHSCKQVIVPSKSQVLYYVSTSTHLRLNHQGSELQVTDPSDFPLLDIWAENVCDEAPVWIMESYGRRVAVVTDTSPRTLLSLIIPFFRPRRTTPSFSVIDWNGDVIGYYVLGSDGIEIQDTRREPIAKCYCEPDNQGETWRIVCEKNAQRQLAVLTPDGHLSFATDIALPLKLLLLATLSRAVVNRTSSSCFPFFR